jgi:hypothetical protein
MDKIKNAINLLEAVHSTMDSISIYGIENQDRFVGCANAIRTVAKNLTEYVQETEAKNESGVVDNG